MSRWGKVISGIVVLAVALAGWGIWQHRLRMEAAANLQNKPVVKIGVSLPLSGNVAYIGQALQGALDIAREELGKRDLKNAYEFIIENNAMETRYIISINNKLLNYDKVDAILDFGSISGKLTTMAVKGKNVLHFNVCASDIAVAEGDNSFLHSTLPDDEAEMLVQIVKERWRAPAIIALNEAHSLISMNSVRDRLQELGISAKTFTINPQERDMRILLAKIEREKPDVYIVLLYSPTFEIFLKQRADAGIKTPITSTHYLENINDLSLVNGVSYIAYGQLEGGLLGRILRHNAGKTSYSQGLGNIYDAVMMMTEAFENSADTAGAIAYLQNMKTWEGSMGASAQDKGVFRIPPQERVIQNGVSVVRE